MKINACPGDFEFFNNGFFVECRLCGKSPKEHGLVMEETLKRVSDTARQETLRQFMAEGYRVRCSGCGTCYKSAPTEPYEDGHGGRELEMCRCGSDMFVPLKEILEQRCFKNEVKPVVVDGVKTLIFHERNFKYCKCHKGEVWTGDTDTECGIERNLVPEPSSASGPYKFMCPKSKYRIIILSKGQGRDDEYFRAVLCYHGL